LVLGPALAITAWSRAGSCSSFLKTELFASSQSGTFGPSGPHHPDAQHSDMNNRDNNIWLRTDDDSTEFQHLPAHTAVFIVKLLLSMPVV
jgi:hypothetical protein